MQLFNFFNSAYKGDEKLWKVFVLGLVPISPITIATLTLFRDLPVMHHGVDYSNLIYSLVVFFWCYYFWFALSIWKCSKNSKFFLVKALSLIFSVFCFLTLFAVARLIVI